MAIRRPAPAGRIGSSAMLRNRSSSLAVAGSPQVQQRPSPRRLSSWAQRAGHWCQYTRTAAGQGRPVRTSPSHQLPISPTTRAKGASARRRSTASPENCPGNAWATTITSGASWPSASKSTAASTSAAATTRPWRSSDLCDWRNSRRSVLPTSRMLRSEATELVTKRYSRADCAGNVAGERYKTGGWKCKVHRARWRRRVGDPTKEPPSHAAPRALLTFHFAPLALHSLVCTLPLPVLATAHSAASAWAINCRTAWASGV